MAVELDYFCQAIDLKKTSVGMTIWPDGQCSISAIDNKYPFNGTFRNGITVFHRADFDEILSIPISATWEVLKKGAPDFGHVVYCVTTFSQPRFNALVDYGKVVFPTEQRKEILDTQRGGAFPTYIGMTSKGAANRLVQHIASASKGSKTRFHRVLKGEKHIPQLPMLNIIRQTQTREACFAAEEEEIKIAAKLEGVISLNTLMGSLDASKLLGEKFNDRKTCPEYAEEALARMASATSLNWEDPDYAEAVICNNDRNLDGDCVREIRLLSALNLSVDTIASKLDVSKARVISVISRKTYGRVI
jgi:hypothetical protein